MLIFMVLGLVVRVSAESISLVEFTWLMVELEVVLLELNLPICSMGSYFVGLTPVCEVLVISPNYDGLIRGSGM